MEGQEPQWYMMMMASMKRVGMTTMMMTNSTSFFRVLEQIPEQHPTLVTGQLFGMKLTKSFRFSKRKPPFPFAKYVFVQVEEWERPTQTPRVELEWNGLSLD